MSLGTNLSAQLRQQDEHYGIVAAIYNNEAGQSDEISRKFVDGEFKTYTDAKQAGYCDVVQDVLSGLDFSHGAPGHQEVVVDVDTAADMLALDDFGQLKVVDFAGDICDVSVLSIDGIEPGKAKLSVFVEIRNELPGSDDEEWNPDW